MKVPFSEVTGWKGHRGPLDRRNTQASVPQGAGLFEFHDGGHDVLGRARSPPVMTYGNSGGVHAVVDVYRKTEWGT